MLRTPTAALFTTGIIGLAALAMACGGGSQGASASGQGADNPTQPAQAAVVHVATPTAAPALAATPTTVPAAASTVAAAPTEKPAALATPANAAPPPPPPPPAPSTLTIDMRDNLFAIPTMRVVAGITITMTVHNEGKNMHNWDLQGVAKTPLQKAGEYQVVTFTVQPGTYTFICDVHPKEMVGTLIAE
jgi:plastocyanin